MITIEDHLPALQVVAPLIFAPILVLLQPRGLAWAAATLVSLYAFVNAAMLAVGTLAGQTYTYKMGNWEPPFGIVLQVDALAALLLLIILVACFSFLMRSSCCWFSNSFLIFW